MTHKRIVQNLGAKAKANIPIMLLVKPIGKAKGVGFLSVYVPIIGCITEARSEEHTSELQSRFDLVCRLLLEKKKKDRRMHIQHKSPNYNSINGPNGSARLY